MREIKFRAWLTLSDYDEDGNDKDYRAMATKISVHHDGSIGVTVDNLKTIFGDVVVDRAVDNGNIYEIDYEWCNWDGFMKLMQYTGLEDKNGTPVYEGDLVLMNPLHKKPHLIQWADGGFAAWSPMINHHLYEYGHNWEVIGNIHESPELLEQ